MLRTFHNNYCLKCSKRLTRTGFVWVFTSLKVLINQVIFTVYDTIQFLLCFYEIFTCIAFIGRLLFLILKCLLVYSCKIFTHAFLRRWLVFSIYKMLTLSLIIFHLTLQPWYCKNGVSVVVDLACISVSQGIQCTFVCEKK